MSTWTFAIYLTPSDSIMVSFDATDPQAAWKKLMDSATAAENTFTRVSLLHSRTHGPNPVSKQYWV